jgi:hypothetical protein
MNRNRGLCAVVAALLPLGQLCASFGTNVNTNLHFATGTTGWNADCVDDGTPGFDSFGWDSGSDSFKAADATGNAASLCYFGISTTTLTRNAPWEVAFVSREVDRSNDGIAILAFNTSSPYTTCWSPGGTGWRPDLTTDWKEFRQTNTTTDSADCETGDTVRLRIDFSEFDHATLSESYNIDNVWWCASECDSRDDLVLRGWDGQAWTFVASDGRQVIGAGTDATREAESQILVARYALGVLRDPLAA